MSSMRLVSGSKGLRALSSLAPGERGIVRRIQARDDRHDRLVALGVTAGAPVTVLQTFPGIVFLCDQTELAVERAVADAVLVKLVEG